MSSGDCTFESKMVKTRKNHKCTFCNWFIIVGETCHVWNGVYDGEIARVHSHHECYDLWDGEEYCPGDGPVPEVVRLRNLQHLSESKG
jgi:hypothetical protein